MNFKHMLPNFLIIGAQKGGTTSLINYLSQHPDVFVPYDKEIPYFHDDEFYKKGIDNYKKCFSGWKGEKIIGHAPVNTSFYAEKAAKRIYEFNKAMKLIMILRNPIDRAYSHYWYCRRNCLEDSKSFEKALERELQMLQKDEIIPLSCVYYISHGFYYKQINKYLEYFDRNQLLILYYDDFKRDPDEILREIYSFLGLEEISQKEVYGKYNVASMPKFRFIHELIFKDNIIKDIYKRIVSEKFRQYAKRTIVDKMLKRNLAPFEYPPMKEETRAFLQNIFREPNRKLTELLGRDFSNWK